VSKNAAESDSSTYLEAERQRMAKSPWASADSPPMDLDYDNSEIKHVLYPQHMQQTGDGL